MGRHVRVSGRVAQGMDIRDCCRLRTLAPIAALGAAAGSAILAGAIGLLLALAGDDCWRCRAFRRARRR
jgi:hypothetical protein